MKTYRQLWEEGAKTLSPVSFEEAEWEAWLLLRDACGISRARFLADGDLAAPAEAEARYLRLLSDRAAGTPTAYLLGEWEFFGLPFTVSPAVLIPRQDTETLVEEALKLLHPGDAVLDLCTGSGCIAVSLAARGPEDLAVWATDISGEALELARENAAKNGVSVNFLKGDFLAALPEGKRFSLIVSNPPYVSQSEYETLQREITEHEPALALVAPENGLYFYRLLAEEGASRLLPDGRIAVEIGEDQGDAVRSLFLENGWKNIRVIRDYAGSDRGITAEK